MNIKDKQKRTETTYNIEIFRRDWDTKYYNWIIDKKDIKTLREAKEIMLDMEEKAKVYHIGKSLTSFKTIIDWCDNIGFKLNERWRYKVDKWQENRNKKYKN